MTTEVQPKSKYKTIALIALSVLATLYIQSILDEQPKTESPYQKAVFEKLIEINGSSTAGVTLNSWQNLTKEISIAANQHKIIDTVPQKQVDQLNKIINNMSETISVWKLRYDNCDDLPIKADCLSRITSILYYNNYPILNPVYSREKDDRFTLNVQNSLHGEYKNAYQYAVENKTIKDPLNEAVSGMLTITSHSINSYFELLGKKL